MVTLSPAYLRYQVKTRWDRFDDEEVRHARAIAWRARRGRLDTLQFGESTTRWISPSDHDRRPLWAMVADGVARPETHLAVHGGSYSVDLFEAYLRFAMQVRRPQAVIVPLWCRGRLTPWLEHPRFSRSNAARAITRIRGDAPLPTIRCSFPRPTPADWDRFHAHEIETFADHTTIGGHVDALKDDTRWTADPEARVKLIYAYHHSQSIAPSGPPVDAVEDLGRALRDFGGPVVVYETPVSVVTGVRHWGQPLAEVVEQNFATMRESLQRGYGGSLDILRTGTDFAEDEFVDPALADEHLNERGRLRLSRTILDALGRVRPDLVRR